MTGSIRILSTAIFCLIAAACAPSGNDSQTDTDGTQSRSTDELAGVWVSTCMDANLFGNKQRMEFLISGSDFTRKIFPSSSGNCSDVTVEIVETGKVSRGREIESGAKQIDITIKRTRVKPVNRLGAELLNAKTTGFCGFKDWQIGVEKDITAATGGVNCYPSTPARYFDLYLIEGDRLYFGEGGPVMDTSIRASQIDRTDYFSKR